MGSSRAGAPASIRGNHRTGKSGGGTSPSKARGPVNKHGEGRHVIESERRRQSPRKPFLANSGGDLSLTERGRTRREPGWGGGGRSWLVVAVRTLPLETFVGLYSVFGEYCSPLGPNNLDGDILSDVLHPAFCLCFLCAFLLSLQPSATPISHDASPAGRPIASQFPLLFQSLRFRLAHPAVTKKHCITTTMIKGISHILRGGLCEVLYLYKYTDVLKKWYQVLQHALQMVMSSMKQG